MLKPLLNEQSFLNSDIYSNFRTLICSERILLSNTYFRFNEMDLRPLLAGSLAANWNEDENMFIPEQNFLMTILQDTGALSILHPKETSKLKECISALVPEKELLIIQQGAIVGEQTFYTDMCIYNNGNKVVTSVIREGFEGFNFELTSDNFASYQIAFDQKVLLVKSDYLTNLFDRPSQFDFLKNIHNKSLREDLQTIKQQMFNHVNSYLTLSVKNTDELPTFIALKLCGPICWYFNRFIQSCLGLHSKYSCFETEQLNTIKSLSISSAQTRNMGLKLSRSQKDKDRIALEKLIHHLIKQIDTLSSLIIN